jgi:hypothetical protein
MIPTLLLWSVGVTFAQDCPATIPETITVLEAEASRLAYECLAKNDEAGAALIARLGIRRSPSPGG